MKTPLMRSAEQALLSLTKLLPELEALYIDIHSHPELSMQETRTASLAAERLRAAGYEVTAADRVTQTAPTSASEDFGTFGAQWKVPSVFWFVGGVDPDLYAKARAAGEVNKIPGNHSPLFAPVLHPTLEAGVETRVVGALAWLSGDDAPAPAGQAAA